VSADGSVIVGGSGEAFIWDPLNGMRSLKAVLESDYGLDLTGWILQYAEDVSADGHTVVGWGLNPDGQSEGWVAQLDAPVAEPGASLLAAAGLLALASRGAVEARRSSSSPAARARGGR
jgi:hypothetical protein